MELMTPEHSRWDEFIDILLGPRGCNVTVQDDDDAPLGFSSTLDGEKNFRRTEAILESMGGFDVKGSIDHLNKVHRVDSDCRILLYLEELRVFERWDQEWDRKLESKSRSLHSKN